MNYFKYAKILEHNTKFLSLILDAKGNELFSKETHRLLAVHWLTWYVKFARMGNAQGRKDNMSYFIEEIGAITRFSK